MITVLLKQSFHISGLPTDLSLSIIGDISCNNELFSAVVLSFFSCENFLIFLITNQPMIQTITPNALAAAAVPCVMSRKRMTSYNRQEPLLSHFSCHIRQVLSISVPNIMGPGRKPKNLKVRYQSTVQ